jgi:hypothetical protein
MKADSNKNLLNENGIQLQTQTNNTSWKKVLMIALLLEHYTSKI